MEEKEIKKKNNLKDTYNKICNKVNAFNELFFKFFHKFDLIFFFALITILSLFLRISLYKCIRNDYVAFLNPWYTQLFENGYKKLGEGLGDYTPMYEYILFFISLFKFNPSSMNVLYAIKTVSVVFDYLLAFIVFWFLKDYTKNKVVPLLGYALTLFGLTIFLNSSLWGQCDAIYCFFCVASLFAIYKKKQRTSMILYGFAFSFKLQSIFILPVFLILYFRRQLKLRYFVWPFIVYFVCALPSAFIANDFFGRLGKIFLVYFNQSANSYKQLSLNAGTFYTVIFNNFKEEEFISSFALFLSFGIVVTLCFLIYRSKKEYNTDTYIKIATLFAMAFPFFLPHMHDRYYYVADVLVIIYSIRNPKKFYVAILAITNSMIGYMTYLWNIPFLDSTDTGSHNLSFRFGGIIYLIAIIVVIIDLFKEIYPNGFKDDSLLNKEKAS